MADCAKGGFNRVAGADALPVLRGESVKRHPRASRSFCKLETLLRYNLQIQP